MTLWKIKRESNQRLSAHQQRSSLRLIPDEIQSAVLLVNVDPRVSTGIGWILKGRAKVLSEKGRVSTNNINFLQKNLSCIVVDVARTEGDLLEFLRYLRESSHDPSLVLLGDKGSNVLAGVSNLAGALGFDVLGLFEKSREESRLIAQIARWVKA